MHKQFNKITSNSMYNCGSSCSGGGVGNNSMVNMNKSMLNSSMMSSMYNNSGGDSNNNYANYLQHFSRIGLVRKRLLNSSACYLEISGEELKHSQYGCGGGVSGIGNNNNNCRNINNNNNNNRNSSVNKSIRCKQASFVESPIKKVRALHKNFSCGDIQQQQQHQPHNKKQQTYYKQSHKQNNLNRTSIINDNTVYDIHTNRKYNNISIVISQPNNKKRVNSVSTICNGNNHNVNKVNKGSSNSHKEIETIEEIHFEFVKVIQSKNKAIYTVHN